MRARKLVASVAFLIALCSCGGQDAPPAPPDAPRYGWLGPTGPGGAGGSSSSPVQGTGSPSSPFTFVACGTSGQVWEWNGTAWACTTPSSGGTIATTGDLLQGDGAGNAAAYAGSTPSACTAGQMTTQSSLSAGGALTQTCTQEMPSSGTALLQASGGSAANYAGSTPSTCGAGSAVQTAALSASGVLTQTCISTGAVLQAGGTSTSGTAGTSVASITATGSNQLYSWTLYAGQTSTTGTQYTITITYSDTTTTTFTSTAASNQEVYGNAGGLMIIQTGTYSSLTTLSAKAVTGISVVTAGTGTGTRAAVISATQRL